MSVVKGKITRISGPIVYAEGLEGCGLYDVVDVGEKKIIGEIIRQNEGKATIQVYEDDTGMKIGEEVICNGRPLSLRLGPGLVGTIYDGIQRPLKNMFEKSGAFLVPGERTEPIDINKKWKMTVAEGVSEGMAISAGMVLGYVQETQSIRHKIMVPPTVKGKTLKSFKGEGEYTVDDVIGTTDLDEEIKLSHYWPLRNPRPYAQKLEVSQPLVTGQRVIDVFFPLSKGGTAAIPGGFGTGKTMTQHAIAKWCDADLIVYIGCGERGNEMTDVLTEFPTLIDPRTGRSLMERTILIANTSNMPVAAREVSLYSGITLAEYYRDMGMHVAIMADSTSRWAEALRELSGRMEEMPAEEGFPAYLPTRLAEFYERAGRVNALCGEEGSVSVIGAVSPPGSLGEINLVKSKDYSKIVDNTSLNKDFIEDSYSELDLYKKFIVEGDEVYMEMSIPKDEFFKIMKLLHSFVDSYRFVLDFIEVLDMDDGLLNITSSILNDDVEMIKIIEDILKKNGFDS